MPFFFSPALPQVFLTPSSQGNLSYRFPPRQTGGGWFLLPPRVHPKGWFPAAALPSSQGLSSTMPGMRQHILSLDEEQLLAGQESWEQFPFSLPACHQEQQTTDPSYPCISKGFSGQVIHPLLHAGSQYKVSAICDTALNYKPYTALFAQLKMHWGNHIFEPKPTP